MKVLFLTGRTDNPSTRWRVLQFLPHFEKCGLVCAVEEWPSGMLAKLSLAGRASEFDIVVLQKRLLPKLLVNRLRKNAKVLIFEFDDMVTMKKTEEGTVRDSPTRDRRFRRTVRLADAVTTTNEYLASVARRVSGDPERVHVFPTVIDLGRWAPRPPRESSGSITIGWMGTSGNLHSMDVLNSPLARLCRRHDGLQVKVVCEQTLAMEGVRLVHKPFALADEVEDVRSFDIAVAPLIEDPWTRGKVTTKLLAYLAAGLPTVASDVNANRIYLRDGENGYLVGTLALWEERLTRLIEDPALRRSLGARARESVERDFSIDSAVPKYLALFERLLALPRK